MILFTICSLALIISLDAFALAFIYGIFIINFKDRLILSLIVGCFHFFMPMLGLSLGEVIVNYLHFKINLVMMVILISLGINMIISFKSKKPQVTNVTLLSMLLFGLIVSVDSLILGVGLLSLCTNYLLVGLIFFIISFLITFVGLGLGQKISHKVGDIAILIGGILLIILSSLFLK